MVRLDLIMKKNEDGGKKQKNEVKKRKIKDKAKIIFPI